MAEILEKLNKEIEELKAKVAPALDMRKAISELRKDRDILNRQAKEISEKIKNTKQIRDSYNQVVCSAKSLRDSINKKLSDLKKSLPKKENKPKEGKDRGKRAPTYKSIKKRIRDLEWKIQTSGVSFPEERNLRNQLQKLEVLRAELQKEEDARNSARNLGREARTHHARVLEFSTKSESIHKELVKLYGELRKLRSLANKKHKEFLAKVNELNVFNKEHEPDFKLLKELKQKLMETKDNLAKASKEAVEKSLVERAEVAFEKFKKGIRVDLRDLQAKLRMEEKKNKNK